MEKLKEALIQFANANPSLFPSDSGNSFPLLIEQSFPQFFPDYQTPNHPPYAAMIYKAIWELNKKGGSSEESISKYIQKEYAELPWAHSTLLKHHLEKLCDGKEICMTHNECYFLAGAESEPEKESNGPDKKRKRRRACKKHKKNGKTGVGVQEVEDTVQIGLHKRKRKKGLKSKRKGNKHAKKQVINEGTKLELFDEANLKQDNEVIVYESHDQNQMLEVKIDDIQRKESDLVQMNKNPEVLQTEQSPDSNPVLHGNGKRVSPRLQSKSVSNKGALSNNIQPISRSASLDKPRIEYIKPKSSKLMTRVPDDEPITSAGSIDVWDPIGSQLDQQPEKLPDDGEHVYKRRGRPSKRMLPEKDEVLAKFKPAAGSRKSQRSTKKGKVGNKKGKLKCKHLGRKKMTRRSSRKKTKS